MREETKTKERARQTASYWPRFLLFFHALSEIWYRFPVEFEWNELFFEHVLAFVSDNLVRFFVTDSR